MTRLKPLATEKAVRLIDAENTLVFETERGARRKAVKEEIEQLFKVKVKCVRSLVRKNKKIVYVRLTKDYPAIDVATKLGML